MSDHTGVERGEGQSAASQDEIALIIVETCVGLRRPPGRTAASLLDEGEREQPKIIRDIRLAAKRVLDHVQAPDQISALKAEKDRLRSECDMLATQATACAEEVDRVRVEIGAVQAENERLRADLRDAIAAQLQASENAADREAHIEDLITALAESERKRVEEITAEREACAAICEARASYFAKTPGCEAAADSYRATAREIRSKRPATPTQETSHVES